MIVLHLIFHLSATALMWDGIEGETRHPFIYRRVRLSPSVMQPVYASNECNSKSRIVSAWISSIKNPYLSISFNSLQQLIILGNSLRTKILGDWI